MLDSFEYDLLRPGFGKIKPYWVKWYAFYNILALNLGVSSAQNSASFVWIVMGWRDFCRPRDVTVKEFWGSWTGAAFGQTPGKFGENMLLKWMKMNEMNRWGNARARQVWHLSTLEVSLLRAFKASLFLVAFYYLSRPATYPSSKRRKF